MFFSKSPDKILAQESPKKIVFDVVERLGRKKKYTDYRDAEKMVWCLNLLFSESKNGTLEQYAANSSGDLFAETRAYLETIKASKARETLDSLNRLLDGKMGSSRNDRIEAISVARSLDCQGFEEQIRELTDSLNWKEIFLAAVAYLREHKDEWV